MRRTTILLTLACLLASAATADASYPGKNGPIVFSKNGDVWSVPATGGKAHDITRAKNYDEGQANVSPNGRRLAFEISGPITTAEIFNSDMKGKHTIWVTRKLSKSGKYLSFHAPAWSPNGKRIAFVCNTFNYNQICVTSAKGGSAKVLARCKSCSMGEPDWGKNNKIAYRHGLDIWVVNGSGGGNHKLPIAHIDNTDAYGYQDPSWSPNGKELTFSVADANTAIDVVDANGGNHRRILQDQTFGDTGIDYNYPVWAPDGKSIGVHVSTVQNPSPQEGFYTVNPDGSNLTFRSGAVTGQYVQPFWATKPR
jgi:Tol biopolymer transport system component